MNASTNSVWLQWSTDASTAAYTIGTTASDWDQTNSAITAASDNIRIYANWAGVVEETQEQKRRRVDLAAARKSALERAEALLQACLTTAQQAQLAQHQYFEVRSSTGKVFRVYRGRAGNVQYADPFSGQVTRYCCHPPEAVPDADTMLAQKLMIETDEPAFVQLANKTIIQRARAA